MKILHIYLLLMAATLFCQGCTQTDSDDALNPGEHAAAIPLQFCATTVQWPDDDTTTDARATRAEIGSVTDLQTHGFGVTAFKTEGPYATGQKPNYLYNEKVEWKTVSPSSSPSWLYTNTKLWPANDDNLISVFAYAPYEDGTGTTGITPSANSHTGDPYVDYTHTFATDITSQTDLLWANREDLVRSTDAGLLHPVELSFSHALAKVLINEDHSACTKIKGLSFSNITMEADFHKTGHLSLYNGRWSDFTSASTPLTPTVGTEFLLIPQTMEVTFTLTFTATNIAGNLVAKVKKTIDFVQNEKNVLKFTVTNDTNFEVIKE